MIMTLSLTLAAIAKGTRLSKGRRSRGCCCSKTHMRDAHRRVRAERDLL
jgi:hypothetical protein